MRLQPRYFGVISFIKLKRIWQKLRLTEAILKWKSPTLSPRKVLRDSWGGKNLPLSILVDEHPIQSITLLDVVKKFVADRLKGNIRELFQVCYICF